MELSFTAVPKPRRCEVFSYLAITYQRENGAIIHPSPQTPTLWGVLVSWYFIPRGAWSYHSPKSPNPHPVRCSPTLLLHTKGSRELSFTAVSKPQSCEVFFYLGISYQGEHGDIIHPSPQTPTLRGVLLPCYYIPRAAGSYHSPKSPNPHPVRCSRTLVFHTKGSMELSFTQVPKPPPCEVFSYLAITYQGEQGAIIHPSPHTPTL